jgi:hypothetical protein
MAKKKLIELRLNESETFETRTVNGGVAITVRVVVITATPASLTKAELTEYVRPAASQDEDGNWVIDNHTVLGNIDSYSHNPEDLVCEVADTLNQWGVSVSDWAPYKLED